MNPYLIENLFGIKGLNIAWYAVIIIVGIVAGIAIANYFAKKRGYRFEMLVDFMVLALPLAIIGARLYYVFTSWAEYADDPISILYIWEGGLAIYGAVIGAVVAAIIFSKWKKVPLLDILDIAAPGLILGQAIGRWGNFVNQEAFGVAVTDSSMQWFPYAVEINKTHYVAEYNDILEKMVQVECTEPWHMATFFYESIWNILVFAALFFYFRKAKHKGNVFAAYLILYGIGRAFIEGLRTDSLWLIPGTIRISQALSIVLIVVGAIYILIMHSKPKKEFVYEGRYALVKEEVVEDIPEEEEAPAEVKVFKEEGWIMDDADDDDAKIFIREDVTDEPAEEEAPAEEPKAEESAPASAPDDDEDDDAVYVKVGDKWVKQEDIEE